jgi:hypothetical protein
MTDAEIQKIYEDEKRLQIAIQIKIKRIQEILDSTKDGSVNNHDVAWLCQYAELLTILASNILPDLKRWCGPDYRNIRELENILRKA